MTAISRENGACDEQVLAAHLLRTPAEINELIAPLVDSGHLTRSPAPGHCAVQAVRLTSRGIRLLARADRTVDLELSGASDLRSQAERSQT